MKKGYLQITILIDRSGSMAPIQDDTIGGINRYVDAQRSHPGLCTVTLAQFDDEYELIYNRVPIANVTPRSRANYEPRGWTALHDAMAQTIDETGAALAALPEADRPERVLFVTMTDGEENSSKRFRADDVRRRIEHQREAYHWEFVFLGANQDAILAAKALGIPRGSTMTYAANAAGTAAAIDSVVRETRSYGVTGQSVNFTSADRMFQASVGAHRDAANDPDAGPDDAKTGTGP
jgi:hypothetical protein